MTLQVDPKEVAHWKCTTCGKIFYLAQQRKQHVYWLPHHQISFHSPAEYTVIPESLPPIVIPTTPVFTPKRNTSGRNKKRKSMYSRKLGTIHF